MGSQPWQDDSSASLLPGAVLLLPPEYELLDRGMGRGMAQLLRVSCKWSQELMQCSNSLPPCAHDWRWAGQSYAIAYELAEMTDD